jgi:hypothetical protein
MSVNELVHVLEALMATDAETQHYPSCTHDAENGDSNNDLTKDVYLVGIDRRRQHSSLNVTPAHVKFAHGVDGLE